MTQLLNVYFKNIFGVVSSSNFKKDCKFSVGK